jgi:hypothetical protein
MGGFFRIIYKDIIHSFSPREKVAIGRRRGIANDTIYVILWIPPHPGPLLQEEGI